MSSQKEIRTSIKINATPDKVWSIFTDFENYPNWNPFISSLTGTVAVGETIKIKLPGMTFKPTVLKFEKNKELRWLGKLFFSGVFDGAHSFILEDNGDGTTTFHQNEIFNGFLVGMFSKQLDRDTKPGFESMNQKLKKLVENC